MKATKEQIIKQLQYDLFMNDDYYTEVKTDLLRDVLSFLQQEKVKEIKMIDVKPPDTGDAYLDKFQDIAHELHNIIEHSLEDEKERVLVLTDFLKDIDWLLCVGHKAYMNNSSDDLHEISKTLKEILREIRKMKV